MILAGGSGTRLWPASREQTPKHLLALTGGCSLLRQSFERARLLTDQVWVISNQSQAGWIGAELPELDRQHLVLEPVARGTTSALGLIALMLDELDPEAVMVNLPADHYVPDAEGFCASVGQAMTVAAASRDLVAVGLRPTYPSTGFGYIEAGQSTSFGGVGAYLAKRFVEKPDLDSAKAFMASGTYFWNLAMFSFRPVSLVQELKRLAPTHLQGLRRYRELLAAGDLEGASAVYAGLPNLAVDYVVMEHTERLLLVAADFAWTDLGSWSDLAAVLPTDDQGNASVGRALLLDAHNCLVHTDSGIVAMIGTSDLIVVNTSGAVLVCPKSRSQEVRRIVERLRAEKQEDYL